MLIVVSATYVVSGMTGILVGHDIVDAMLMTYLAVGAYLAAGTSLLDKEDSPERPASISVHPIKADTRSVG